MAENRLSTHKAPRAAEVVPQILWDLLMVIEGLLEDRPQVDRITLRDARAKLVRAFPRQFLVNESELAQQLAEEDGDEIES